MFALKFSFLKPHRYRHINQFIDAFETEGGEGKDVKEKINRKEELIVKESKRTGFRYRRLASYMLGKYSIKISEDTIKAILRRNKVKKKTRRSYNGKQRSLYDYEALMPFSEFQLDTKHLMALSILMC